MYKQFIIPVLFTLFFIFESLFPFKKYEGKIIHDLKNIAVGVFNSLLAFIVVKFVYNYLPRHNFLHPAIAILLFDVWMYWWHRLNHISLFLWRFHKYHHSEEELDASSIFRFNPIEIIFSTLLRIPIIVALGIPVEVLLVYEIAMNINITFHHSNIQLPDKLDRIHQLLFVSPAMHKIHHSIVIKEANSNYGAIFSFWDRIFRSFTKPDGREITYGL